jgi:hypothetical protein
LKKGIIPFRFAIPGSNLGRRTNFFTESGDVNSLYTDFQQPSYSFQVISSLLIPYEYQKTIFEKEKKSFSLLFIEAARQPTKTTTQI